MADMDTIRAAAYIRAARDLHDVEGECEIDDLADVHESPDHVSCADAQEGAYVKAWVWVPLDAVTPEHVDRAAIDVEEANA